MADVTIVLVLLTCAALAALRWFHLPGTKRRHAEKLAANRRAAKDDERPFFLLLRSFRSARFVSVPSGRENSQPYSFTNDVVKAFACFGPCIWIGGYVEALPLEGAPLCVLLQVSDWHHPRCREKHRAFGDPPSSSRCSKTQ